MASWGHEDRGVSAPLLEVEGLHVRYGDARDGAPPALADVSLTVGRGEFVAVVGPSGSGKTTLLRCLAGLQPATGGSVRLHGMPITDVPDELAIVFQDYGRSLFPWMTVSHNVDMPLRHRRIAPDERRARVDAALDEVGLGEQHDRYPWQLSGGMQQRVAIARAIAYRPEILLMDEPFGSVDAQTRADLQDQLLEVWRAHASTIVLVTHDIDESVYLADRVVVLSPPPGRVAADISVDLARPRDQIETRASAGFVALRSEVARLVTRAQPPA
jgi:NitT/TauT family transport system ATP-binding protein